MNLLIILQILATFVTLATSIEISCKYDNYNKWMLNVQSNFSAQHKQLIYECIVTDVEITNEDEDKRKVSVVSGNHNQNKTNEHVRSFGVGNRVMHFMPQELEKFFTNLIAIDIYSTGLQEIDKTDLKPYPNLKFLSLTNNELQVIDFDLFVYNPNLEVLLLWGNKIETVNDAFEILPNLRYLSFKNNPCLTNSNHVEVAKLIDEIHKNCEPDFEKAFEQCKSVLKMIQDRQNNAETLIVGSPLIKNGQSSFTYNYNFHVIFVMSITILLNF